MGKLRAVPKFQPSSFAAVNLGDHHCPPQLEGQSGTRSLRLCIGQYAIEIGPEVDWNLLDRLLDRLEERAC
jgi:hypothetical protein